MSWKNYKEDSLEEIIESEKQIVIDAKEKFGMYYSHAVKVQYLLKTFIEDIISTNWYGSPAFIGQIKKHFTLALLSTLRLHDSQYQMNLRQMIEATSRAVFGIANSEKEHFFNKVEKGRAIKEGQKVSQEKYEWLEKNYSDFSGSLHGLKKLINRLGLHTGFATAHLSLNADEAKKEDNNINRIFCYFDNSNHFNSSDNHIKQNLTVVSSLALLIMHLIYEANLKDKYYKIQDNFVDNFIELMKESDNLTAELNRLTAEIT